MHVKSVPYKLGGHLVTPRTAPVSFLTGVVLAGGKSRRMGQDKAALTVGRPLPSGERGPALVFHMADVLGQALHVHNPEAAIWISCQADRHIPASHAHLGRVHDIMQDAGPLAGITAALEAAKGPIFVLACDMPFMQCQTVQLLIEARQAALHDSIRPRPLLLTAFQGHGKSVANVPNMEPLVAIYEYAALPYLQDALRKKHFSLRRIIDQEALCVVPYGQNHEESFFNMNNPDDFYKATQSYCATLGGIKREH